MIRGLICAALFAGPATAQSFDEAVRGNLALGIDLCVRHLPNVATLRATLDTVGFTFSGSQGDANDATHWYAAPGETALVGVYQGQMAPDCRLISRHIGATATDGVIAGALEASFPSRFTLETIALGGIGIVPGTPGGESVPCTAYVDLQGVPPVYVAFGNTATNPVCVEDGTTQIIISR